MIDLNDYFYFVHVVEKQGFSPAAKALNMPKSRLSRHVSKLEERLDIKLIQRTSRQFNVTETGKIFYQHARALLEEMEAAEAAIQSRKTSLSGRVTISCSVGVAQFAIKDLVLQFLVNHPKVDLVQQVTNQNIDLVSSGIDMAIRGHTWLPFHGICLPALTIYQRLAAQNHLMIYLKGKV
jgi:DNA-binding transcriptional LysR family regulator